MQFFLGEIDLPATELSSTKQKIGTYCWKE
jgi:hypothetical protein